LSRVSEEAAIAAVRRYAARRFRECLVQGTDAFELTLFDSELGCDLGIVSPVLLDEALGVLASHEHSRSSPSGKSGERASSTTA